MLGRQFRDGFVKTINRSGSQPSAAWLDNVAADFVAIALGITIAVVFTFAF